MLRRGPGRRRRVLVAVLVLAAAAVGVTVQQLVQPPAEPPPYDGPRPEPVASGYTTHREAVFVRVPLPALVDWANSRELTDVVTPSEGVPVIVRTTPLRGDWVPGDRIGDRRRVEFSDGHFLAEEVLADEPDRFRYMIWGFTSYQRFAVRHAVAEFLYTERPGGTEVAWTYSFLPTSPVLAPAVRGFVGDAFAPMMRATLEGMRVGAERDS